MLYPPKAMSNILYLTPVSDYDYWVSPTSYAGTPVSDYDYWVMEFLKVSELNLIIIKCKMDHHTESHTSIVLHPTLELVDLPVHLSDLALQEPVLFNHNLFLLISLLFLLIILLFLFILFPDHFQQHLVLLKFLFAKLFNSPLLLFNRLFELLHLLCRIHRHT